MYKYLLLLILIVGLTGVETNAIQQNSNKPPVTVKREINKQPTVCFENCQKGQVYVPPTARDGRRMRKMCGIRPKTMKNRRYEKNYARPRSAMKYINGHDNIMERTKRRNAYMKRYDSPEYKQYMARKKPDQISRFNKSCPCSVKQKPVKRNTTPKIVTHNGITYYNYR